jgi:hypothetical protein
MSSPGNDVLMTRSDPKSTRALHAIASIFFLAACSDGASMLPRGEQVGSPSAGIGETSAAGPTPLVRSLAVKAVEDVALDPATRSVDLRSRQHAAVAEYAIQRGDSAHVVSLNHAHGMVVRYESARVVLEREPTRDGPVPDSADEAALSFAGVGRAGQRSLPALQRQETHGAQVDYEREGLKEWYLNGPLGLEQGFLLARAPEGSGPVDVATAIAGDLSPVLSEEGSSVELRNTSGTGVLRISDLFVSDANGKALESSFVVQGNEVVLRFDDRGATYPVNVDPYISRLWGRAQASTPQTYAAFGTSVAVSSSLAVIGAPGDGHSGSSNTDGPGAVYVFKRTNSSWAQVAKLAVANLPAGSKFGASVAIGSTTCDIVVGAPAYTSGGSAIGAAYVYASNANCSAWTLQAQLRASDGLNGDQFGYSVSEGNDTILVGAPFVDGSNSPNMGAAYLYSRSGTTWSQTKRVVGRVFGGDHFGTSVSINSMKAYVGNPGYDGKASNCGRVYVYQRESNLNNNWSLSRTLDPPSATSSGRFGEVVNGDEIGVLIGEPGADDLGTDSGAVHVFAYSNGNWPAVAKLMPSTAGEGTQYANVVRGGRSLAIGPMAATAGSLPIAVFTNDQASAWTQTASVAVPSNASGTKFGAAIAFSRDALLVGAPADGQSASPNGGAAYFFGVGSANGTDCTGIYQDCASGFCVDGVCCDTVCGIGHNTADLSDCQACSVAAGGTTNGTCTPLTAAKAASTLCRTSAGVCDVPETCSTSSRTCPANGFKAFGTECSNTNRFCDPIEYCTGAGATCPADVNLCF